MSDEGPDFALILERVYACYGRKAPSDGDDVLGVLIATVLSQATTQANARRAFDTLIESFAGEWSAVVDAGEDEVVAAIRTAGLGRQKARRIRGILQSVYEAHGEYSLEPLRQVDDESAYRVLTSFKGVGPKTAKFVMMEAMGRDVFPMDTHIFRIARRTGFLVGNQTDSKAHRVVGAQVPEGESYAAHMALVAHGRQVCHAQSPACDECTLVDLCPQIGVD